MAKTVKKKASGAKTRDRRAQGLAVLRRLGWGTNEQVRAIDEDLWALTVDGNFGAVWSRPGLSLRDREMICIAALVTLGAPGVGAHFRQAHKVGLTNAELKEIVLQVMPYAGLPKALGAMNILKKVIRGEATSL
jgi:4-carboxymuconolactone decarboxylase